MIPLLCKYAELRSRSIPFRTLRKIERLSIGGGRCFIFGGGGGGLIHKEFLGQGRGILTSHQDFRELRNKVEFTIFEHINN